VLDRRDVGLPVYPVAVLSHAEPCSKNYVPLLVDFPYKRVLDFHFDLIDLVRLDARVFVQCPKPAALALGARMKVDPQERISLARDFFVSLAETTVNRQEQELVAGFFSAYHPLRLAQVEALGESLPEFKSRTDLSLWLTKNA
jgi:hypothetical protein